MSAKVTRGSPIATTIRNINPILVAKLKSCKSLHTELPDNFQRSKRRSLFQSIGHGTDVVMTKGQGLPRAGKTEYQGKPEALAELFVTESSDQA